MTENERLQLFLVVSILYIWLHKLIVSAEIILMLVQTVNIISFFFLLNL